MFSGVFASIFVACLKGRRKLAQAEAHGEKESSGRASMHKLAETSFISDGIFELLDDLTLDLDPVTKHSRVIFPMEKLAVSCIWLIPANHRRQYTSPRVGFLYCVSMETFK